MNAQPVIKIFMKQEKFHWFKIALRLQGSVVPSILSRVVFCGIFGFLISVFHQLGLNVSIAGISNLIPNIVLGLLLVFRTNTAYERFWEGRKCWGNIVNTVRNLARQLWVTVAENDPQDRERKIETLRLLTAFAVATKLHLRGETVNFELETLLSKSRFIQLKSMNNPPLEVAFWIGDYLQEEYHKNNLNIHQLNSMQQLLNILVDNLGACERILKTPIPLAYAIHLKQLLLIYCLSLPFQMVKDLTWWTGIAVALISFTLFGIEEIGIEIENPFGRDPNDLPLDAICTTMQRNIEDLISLAPSVKKWQTPNIYQ